LGSIGLLYSIVGMKICPVFVLMIVIIWDRDKIKFLSWSLLYDKTTICESLSVKTLINKFKLTFLEEARQEEVRFLYLVQIVQIVWRVWAISP
jgi:hypothetical protein